MAFLFDDRVVSEKEYNRLKKEKTNLSVDLRRFIFIWMIYKRYIKW